MNGVPVEEHIRAVVKDLLRTRGIAKTGLVTDLHGSRKIPYKGMKNRLSLQVNVVDRLFDDSMINPCRHNFLCCCIFAFSFLAGICPV